MLLDRLDSLFETLAACYEEHSHETPLYRLLNEVTIYAFHEAQGAFEKGEPVRVGEFHGIILPYQKMGAVDSLDLFGLDELLLFAFYHRNRSRYPRAADIGANLGLHTIMLSKSGATVESYEPDPEHFAKLQCNLELNGIRGGSPRMAAVSEKKGEMEFLRVVGNTTSSHLAGAKANPYGPLDRFNVKVEDVKEIAERVDFMKIDAEGHEAVILGAIPIGRWSGLDSVVEIGTPENAASVFEHFKNTDVNIFSQKLGWSRVSALQGMPTSHRDGGIFISSKPHMPWE